MRTRKPLAAQDQPRALPAADVEVGEVLVELALVDHRPDVGARRKRIVDLERPSFSATAATKRS